jgi:hypothetical protein
VSSRSTTCWNFSYQTSGGDGPETHADDLSGD